MEELLRELIPQTHGRGLIGVTPFLTYGARRDG